MTLTVTTLFNEFPDVFARRVIISLLILSVLILISLKLYKSKKFDKTQFVSAAALSAYFTVMLYFMILGRYSQSFYRADFVLFHSYFEFFGDFNRNSAEQILINLAMFVPIGFLMCIILKNIERRYIVTVFVSLALTFALETTQYFSRTGTFEADDIFNNVVGAVVGVLAFKFAKRMIKNRKKLRNH